MFSENWTENNANEKELKNYSYSVYYSFLKYLYVDFVEMNSKIFVIYTIIIQKKS
jgi:hypothetical protein